MCGIAGILASREAAFTARRMIAALQHRGPDDLGVEDLCDEDGVLIGAFAHARLSILDLSEAGHQPMTTPDGRFTITFNGEIYNFRQLRETLLCEGAEFRSASDTEVILQGWMRHGMRFLPRLRGMFAFALWDRKKAICYLVRDGFGIKPLYYTVTNGTVCFASEIRAILASGQVTRQISAAGVSSYLSYGSVQDPLTIIEGVRALPAGSFLEVRLKAAANVSAPTPFPPSLNTSDLAQKTSRREASKAIREAIRDSVTHHLVSDVPVGFFLSGGLDSSSLVAVASEIGVTSIETFTVTFAEADFNEALPAHAVASRYSNRHHEIPLSGADLLQSLPDVFRAMDQPSMDGINTFVVSRAVASCGLKVVISGLGADEVFGGYPSFARARLVDRLQSFPRSLRTLVAVAASRMGSITSQKVAIMLREEPSAHGAFLASRTLFPDPFVAQLLGRAPDRVIATADPARTLLEQVSSYETAGYMRSTLLRDTDVFSMAHGLEVRVPFVDVGVATAAASINDTVRWSGAGAKGLLLDAVHDLLPHEVRVRRKQGFTLPWAIWLRHALQAEVAAAFEQRRLLRVGLSFGATHRIWRDFLAGRRGVTWSRPWSLYTLVRWAEQNDVSIDATTETAAFAGALAS